MKKQHHKGSSSTYRKYINPVTNNMCLIAKYMTGTGSPLRVEKVTYIIGIQFHAIKSLDKTKKKCMYVIGIYYKVKLRSPLARLVGIPLKAKKGSS
jgi:hypothetical protein